VYLSEKKKNSKSVIGNTSYRGFSIHICPLFGVLFFKKNLKSEFVIGA
jgi:hypothetical protein